MIGRKEHLLLNTDEGVSALIFASCRAVSPQIVLLRQHTDVFINGFVVVRRRWFWIYSNAGREYHIE